MNGTDVIVGIVLLKIEAIGSLDAEAGGRASTKKGGILVVGFAVAVASLRQLLEKSGHVAMRIGWQTGKALKG